MAIAIGIVGMGFTVLGIALTYIWRSNHTLQNRMIDNQEVMMKALERIEEAAKEVGGGQKAIVQMLSDHTKIIERIEANTRR